LFAHDLIRKPVPTFQDHALAVSTWQKNNPGTQLGSGAFLSTAVGGD